MSIRLQKFLASAGVGSRRGCEELIQKGLVKVNGKIASIGSSVSSEDEVEYQNKIIRSKEVSLKVIILNKPPGVLSSNVREKDLPRVFDYLPRSSNQRDWISIGRLDINTSGLMLFTNEGVFANYCMHPSNSIDREYLVRAKGSFNSDKEAQMRKGIEIDGSIHKFSDLVEGEKTGANQWFSACLTSGKNWIRLSTPYCMEQASHLSGVCPETNTPIRTVNYFITGWEFTWVTLCLRMRAGI